MILEISKTNVLWMPVTYYTIKGDDDVIEKIILDGKELNLYSETDLLKAIDALVDSKKSANFSMDETNSINDLFGATFGTNITRLAERFNTITENLIRKIENMRISLINANYSSCNGCELLDVCSSHVEPDCDLGICPDNGCCGCEYHEETPAETEARQASDAVEAVSKTRTFHWAQKYMDNIIDPHAELTGAEYNTLLAMFTQYGEWILKQ
jgi:hypothetical protein